MSEKPYHHGNLRTELIEAGIEIINNEGLNSFSLRKVAAKCNVSHTAPYSHFKDIDALVNAMGEYVTGQFMNKLQASIAEKEDGTEAVSSLGLAYIEFFIENPQYFQFLFYHSGLTINLDKKNPDDYPPFALFRTTAYKMFEKNGSPKEAYPEGLASLWSVVHGIVALLTNSSIHYSGDWQQVFINIIK
ncbi:TetR/AcrR family transcriptional regulator [Anaerocolumna xylanovorans]|uniref:Transcriptional regulator, TetR family n=1 Tax=Anaerocolumna xylanovorans DSM 12503 TaxID=1121345 RepID=A0A1M7Y8M6_9FIRM|nr:TetR/AcrR family transcriptional regulator [Anaerocolumna xylanovorans]SHO48878.1 transcriptional regulator, TetR family [Anaerocolumna xylanovorans DSM 12503]